MKNTDKLTMTLGQLKRLVSEAKKSTYLDDWQKADSKLKSKKNELAKLAKDVQKEIMEIDIVDEPLFQKLMEKLGKKFNSELKEKFIKNNISYHADSPAEAAEYIWNDLTINNDLSASELANEMYLYDSD